MFDTFYSFLRTALIFAFCLSNPVAMAGVYHCINQAGVREFSDKPCFKSSVSQEFLPYIYQRTLKAEIQSSKKENVKKTKQPDALEKKRLRQNARIQTQIKKEAMKKSRLQIRCVRTEEKVKVIENQLRLGCKLRRCQRLKRELEHAMLMKSRYCANG